MSAHTSNVLHEQTCSIKDSSRLCPVVPIKPSRETHPLIPQINTAKYSHSESGSSSDGRSTMVRITAQNMSCAKRG